MNVMERYNIFSMLITSDNASLESKLLDYKYMKIYFQNILTNLEYYNNAYRKSLESLTNELNLIETLPVRDVVKLDGVKRVDKIRIKNLRKFLQKLRVGRLNDSIKVAQENYNETCASIEKYKNLISEISNTIYSCEILMVFYYTSTNLNLSDDRKVEMIAICDVDC
jgi:hypothetical protein